MFIILPAICTPQRFESPESLSPPPSLRLRPPPSLRPSAFHFRPRPSLYATPHFRHTAWSAVPILALSVTTNYTSMIRVLRPRFNGSNAMANAATLARSLRWSPLSSRALSISPASASSVVHSPFDPTKLHPNRVIPFHRRLFHGSAMHSKSVGDVHVTIESGSSSSNDAKTEQSATKHSIGGGDACSHGIPNAVEEEEDPQEEMFVVADPVLGHGNIQEWGGPRRGGTLSEPTRFGDWERKGRCSDF